MTIKTEQLGDGHNKTTIELDRPEAYRILNQLVSVLSDPFKPMTEKQTVSWMQETKELRQDLCIEIRSFHR